MRLKQRTSSPLLETHKQLKHDWVHNYRKYIVYIYMYMVTEFVDVMMELAQICFYGSESM